MKALLVPVILLIVGVGSGVGAGIFLKPADPPPSEDIACTCADQDLSLPDQNAADAQDEYTPTDNTEYAKLANQFIVPLVNESVVTGLVVMSITLEVPEGGVEDAFALEPRLRDGFLQVMFDHANVGGFDGNFTSSSNMRVLRRELLQSARRAAGDKITDVLILDIVRQDV